MAFKEIGNPLEEYSLYEFLLREKTFLTQFGLWWRFEGGDKEKRPYDAWVLEYNNYLSMIDSGEIEVD